jgi:hypothetical protein
MHIGYWWRSQKERDNKEDQDKMWVDNIVTCKSTARQCQQHTRGQQYKTSVFFVSAYWTVAIQCGDVTQQQ